jgi:hypothetical protein
MDGILHELWAVNANWNDDGWNVNANSIDNPNDWNADNQVFSRNYFLSPTPVVGVFASRPFFQPPTILPTSSLAQTGIRTMPFLFSSVGIIAFSGILFLVRSKHKYRLHQ